MERGQGEDARDSTAILREFLNNDIANTLEVVCSSESILLYDEFGPRRGPGVKAADGPEPRGEGVVAHSLTRWRETWKTP